MSSDSPSFRLERNFESAYDSFLSFQSRADIPFGIAITRESGLCYPFSFRVSEDFEESYFMAKKILLSLLWMIGGERILLGPVSPFAQKFLNESSRDEEIQSSLKAASKIMAFDISMSLCPALPERKDIPIPFGDSFSGHRIGLDLGGSDRKVTACVDGKVVYSEEVLWDPKSQEDWHYQEEGIRASLLSASSHLERVDAVGVSTAGVVLDNELTFPALFRSVPEDDLKAHVRPIFKQLIPSLFGNVPFQVENDGDVSAIGAQILFRQENVLGLALGTSFAAGYAENGHLLSWINELSKCPVNFSKNARKHYLFSVQGAASEYLSQKGIILLLENNGMELHGSLAEKLLQIQAKMKENDPLVRDAYCDMGLYLGTALAYLSLFYPVKSALLLGRVMTGEGGDLLLEKAKEYLDSRGIAMDLLSGDENFKRLGQSYIAACLPKL